MMSVPESSREPGTRIPITFPEEMYEWLREIAYRRHVSIAEVVRQAVREHRERAEPQLPLPMHSPR